MVAMLVWVTSLLALLAGCAGVEEQVRPPIPLPALSSQSRATLENDTQAEIRLAGIPPTMQVDQAGQIVVASGLENVGLGTIVLLAGGGVDLQPAAIASYQWTVRGPPNSNVALDDPASPTPSLIPDRAGFYTVTLTIADQAGVTGRPASLMLHAGSWVGNGAVRNAPEDPNQCANCHREKLAGWRETRHAVTLKRAMDGRASPHYLENCVHCHTVGKNAIADNNGFDDLARALDWRYPTTLALGNYANFVADYPQLANLGNTQCELCHGPGSAHGVNDPCVEQPDDRCNRIAVSLRPELCIQCHDFLQQDRHAQWVRSGHADTSLPRQFPAGIDDPVCAACHTSAAMIAVADGDQPFTGDAEQLTCQACHDPHAAPGANHYQVRRFDSVTLPDGARLDELGSSALCFYCHNVGEPAVVVTGDEPFLPPQAAAAEMIAGVGGYTFGETLTNSPHTASTRWYGTCVNCHMVSASVEESGDFLSASMNEPVGEHSFRVGYDNGTPADPADDYENLRACAGCHGQVPRLNGPAEHDYDGDGTIEGVQDEVRGLLDLVRAELIAANVRWLDEPPYWLPPVGQESAANNSPRNDGIAAPPRTHTLTTLRAAVYNWSYVNNEGSYGLHNTARAVELLQVTYRELTGRQPAGATWRASTPPTSTLQERFAAERSPLARLGWIHILLPGALLFFVGLLATIVRASLAPTQEEKV